MLFCRQSVEGMDCGCGERVESATGRNQYVLTVRNTFELLSRQVTRSYDRRREVEAKGWRFKRILSLQNVSFVVIVVAGKK